MFSLVLFHGQTSQAADKASSLACGKPTYNESWANPTLAYVSFVCMWYIYLAWCDDMQSFDCIPPQCINRAVCVCVHRGYRICSIAKDFVSYACEVGSILRGNGCSIKRLKTLFKSFVVQ